MGAYVYVCIYIYIYIDIYSEHSLNMYFKHQLIHKQIILSYERYESRSCIFRPLKTSSFSKAWRGLSSRSCWEMGFNLHTKNIQITSVLFIKIIKFI